MTTIINFKTDPKVKKESQKLAKKFGLSLSDVLNILLRNFIQERELNIRERYSPKFLRDLEEAEEEIKREEVSPAFENVKDLDKWFDSQKLRNDS